MNKTNLIRTMIVDDEEPARSELRFLLEQHPEVCVVCEAGSFKEAVAAIRQCQPHLIFLDVEMPGTNGIRLAETVRDNFEPLIVFATAHEEFALKAFELDAVDYLLKPFSAKRIAQCIAKVRNLMAAGKPVQVPAVDGGNGTGGFRREKLAVEQDGKTCVIDVKDIIAVRSIDGHVCLFTAEKTYQVSMTLQELQSRLDEEQFFRSHRGFLVNIACIREIIPWFSGTYNLTLQGLPNLEIPVSRQQVPKLKKIFAL